MSINKDAVNVRTHADDEDRWLNPTPVFTKSCLVKASDFNQPWFIQRKTELDHKDYTRMHRKLWEFCAIAQVYEDYVCYEKTDLKCLGFGVGTDPLSKWLFRSAEVVATDLDINDPRAEEWVNTRQHASETSLDYCDYRSVDMNDIPDDLKQGQFDFTWSCGSFEHIGGIDASLRFFCEQMKCLRPGGIAAHTTEYNYANNHETLQAKNLVLFRKQDLERLAEMLKAQGDELLPLDFSLGNQPEDTIVDEPPYDTDNPHLKLRVGGFLTTSILLIARRGSGNDKTSNLPIFTDSQRDIISKIDKINKLRVTTDKDKETIYPISSSSTVYSGGGVTTHWITGETDNKVTDLVEGQEPTPIRYDAIASDYLAEMVNIIKMSNEDKARRNTVPKTILWLGDAVVKTGFSRCTHAVCDHLHSLGWNVHVLGINYYGDPHKYSYKIYPCYQPVDGGHDKFGVTRLPLLIDRIKPDIVVILQDPWNINGYFQELEEWEELKRRAGVEVSSRPKIISWLAVDSKNQHSEHLNKLDHIIVWTEFAVEEIKRGGYEKGISIVPLGVDTDIFRPIPKSEARQRTCAGVVKDTDFVVGFVGRNQVRKRLDLLIQYYAEWRSQYKITDSWLYLHVAPTGERGYDVRSLIRYYGLTGSVLMNEPSVGQGEPELLMPYVYSAFDVFMSASQAEGWNLPALEAMACGTPCILADWAGHDWAKGGSALLIPCTSTAMTAPQNGRLHTIGGIMDKENAIDVLHSLYTKRTTVNHDDCFTLTSKLTWKSTVERFTKVLVECLK